MGRLRIGAPLGTRSRRVLAGGLLTVALMLGASTADAALACVSYEAMSEQLKTQFAEVPIAAGLAHTGKLLQVFANEDGSSWTVVLTQPDGVTYIVAAGRYWQSMTPKNQGRQV